MKKGILQLCVVAALGICSFGNAQYSISYAGDTGGEYSVEEGTSITINYTYTADADYTGQFQIFQADNAGIFGGTNEGFESLGAAHTTGTDLAGSVTFDIPLGFTLTDDLPMGDAYYLFGKVGAPDDSDALNYWALDGVYPTLIVVAEGTTLSAPSFNIGDDVALHFNNATKSLDIQKDLNEKLSVYDMTGRMIATVDAKQGTSLNLSTLNAGVYIAKGQTSASQFRFFTM